MRRMCKLDFRIIKVFMRPGVLIEGGCLIRVVIKLDFRVIITFSVDFSLVVHHVVGLPQLNIFVYFKRVHIDPMVEFIDAYLS